MGTTAIILCAPLAYNDVVEEWRTPQETLENRVAEFVKLQMVCLCQEMGKEPRVSVQSLLDKGRLHFFYPFLFEYRNEYYTMEVSPDR